jgi:hypothetical protein
MHVPLGFLLLLVQLGKFAILENVPLLELHHVKLLHPHLVHPFSSFLISRVISIRSGDGDQPLVHSISISIFIFPLTAKLKM